jgi:tetratricopeptide (TPR) repeat protein
MAFEERLRSVPNDAQSRVFLGLALAYMGRRSEAVEEGQAGLALQPVAKDAWWGAYFQHQLVRIYILIGEPEKALDRLESLLKIPSLPAHSEPDAKVCTRSSREPHTPGQEDPLRPPPHVPPLAGSIGWL